MEAGIMRGFYPDRGARRKGAARGCAHARRAPRSRWQPWGKPMHRFRFAMLCALLLGLAACTGPGTPRVASPPPHMGDGTDML